MISDILKRNKYIELIRTHHWVKNFFIFGPVFFSGTILISENILNLIIGFFSFSFVASSIYIFNDIKDAEYDKLHPEKRNRPIASGNVTIKKAYFLMSVLLVIGLASAFIILPNFGFLVLVYFVINLAYTLSLKKLPIVDITCISLGFVIRVYSGGVLGEVIISHWLIIMTFLLALFLALGKRRDDVILFEIKGDKMRKAIDGYNKEFINQSMMLMAAVLIVCYIMYTTSQEVEERFNDTNLYFSSFFVVIGLLRYLQIAFVEENSGSPTKILLKDKFIQICILSWVLFFFYVIYL